MSNESTTTHYLNTDLDLNSPNVLTTLATALENESLQPLHVTRVQDDHWYATFETTEMYDEPEPNIASMLDAVESLDEPLREIWNSCVRREFNIGYDCGSEPWAFNHGLSNQLLRRVSEAGASLRITLYPAMYSRKT